MSLTEIDQLLIEKKLDNALTDTETITFNQRLADADFADALRRQERAVQAVKAFGHERLKAMLMEEEEKLQAETTIIEENEAPQYNLPKTPKMVSLRPVWQRLAMAASILLVVSVAIWYFFQDKKTEQPTQKTIYASYFKVYRNIDAPTVRGATSKNNIEKALAFYDNEEFDTALVYFEKIKTPEYDYDALLQANAYLATNQTEKALPILEKLSQDTTSKEAKPAEWYLALALAKTNEQAATTVFDKIKNTTGHPYQKKAAEILVVFKM